MSRRGNEHIVPLQLPNFIYDFQLLGNSPSLRLPLLSTWALEKNKRLVFLLFAPFLEAPIGSLSNVLMIFLYPDALQQH
jgi:hypothetical protein